ncbi:MAG: type III pantothenate kinase [Betaproteobacteria bacterium]|nr:type III pantothenate kinase [Betaproteobacteria bacterium]
MILCLDSGNSRIKWALHDGAGWVADGAVAQGEAGALTALAANWPKPERVLLANVAGVAAADAIRAALAPWAARFLEVASAARGAGVENLYDVPGRLGVDRWCALAGARALTAGTCLVVLAGTATTVDALAADGRFLGGLILPGVDLMRRALARDTAALPLAEGSRTDWPRRTEDAITSGCLEAQTGAIERAWHRLGGQGECLLAGGAAPALAPLLDLPVRHVPLLVMEGLLRLGVDAVGNPDG